MAQDYHLFHVRSEEFSGIKTDYDLPFSDESYFISGFLVDKRLTDEALIRTNEHNFARKSNYYLGQTILEDHEPKSGQDFELQDKGGFMVTLSGPGYNNTDNHSKFEDRWEKQSIKDVLTIRPDFTWDRKKEIDQDFFLLWNGTYSFVDNLIAFSLSERGYQGFNNITPNMSPEVVKYHGLMYGPITDTNKIGDTIQALISGIISEDVNGIITGTVNGTATGVVSGNSTVAVRGLINGTFTNFVTVDVAGEATGTAAGVIEGFAINTQSAMGYGYAKNTQISGILTGNIHDILSSEFIICNGEGLALNVLATIEPTNFEIKGDVEGTVDNVPINGTINKAVDNIRINGNANGYVNNVQFSCPASGYVDNVSIGGTINGFINNVLISGKIEQVVNNILISGNASGYAYNTPASCTASTVLNNVFITDTIFEISNNIQIAGLIEGLVNNVPVQGEVKGVLNGVILTGLGTGVAANAMFSNSISGIVYGQISVKHSEIIIDENIITDDRISTFKIDLYNAVSPFIGTNEESFFGSTSSEIKTQFQNVINDTVDYNSLYNIIVPKYLSKDEITYLTDKILFDMIIANGNYIKGDAKFLEALKGKISIDGHASLDGDIDSDARTGTGGSTSHNHTRNGYTTGNTTGGGGADGHTHGFNDYYETLSNADISHTHSIAGELSITNGTIDIDEADFTATVPNETDIEIRGANISSFRNIILTKIEETIISIMKNVPINQTVYGVVEQYEISDNITGEVSGTISASLSKTVSDIAYSTATGYATGLISGYVTNNVTRTITAEISNTVYGTASGNASATASILAYVPGMGDIIVSDIILNSFLDDSFSDTTNFYNISGLTVSNITNGIPSINSGGRGQLLNYSFLNHEFKSGIVYDVGSWSYNTNTQLSSFSGMIQAVHGNNTEFPIYNNYFGGIGGNIILNSLDLYEKNIPENGFVKIKYSSPMPTPINNMAFRDLTVTTGDAMIVVLPDFGATVISGINGSVTNKMLIQNETDVYYRILDRAEDLDLVNSKLNDIPLSGYTIKYLERPESISGKYEYTTSEGSRSTEFEQARKSKYTNTEIYITELDNHRRKMSFITPFKSNISGSLPTDIKLDLKTTKRKFYFAIARDNEIDTVKINQVEYYLEDMDEDGLYKRHKNRNNETGIIILDKDGEPIYNDTYYGIIAGTSCSIEIQFKNDMFALTRDLFPEYLGLDKRTIAIANNFIQIINIEMPPKDVLLFLKTEKIYALNIFKSEGSDTIIEIMHEGETELPIIKKHYLNDTIRIEVKFSSAFAEVDKEDLRNQLPDVDDIRWGDVERNHQVNVGYEIDTQIIKFLMPPRDVTLYIKEKDYRHKLTIRSYDRRSDNFDAEDNSILNHFDKIKVNTQPEIRLRRDGEIIYGNEGDDGFRVGDPIEILVYFNNDSDGGYGKYYELDVEFIKTQLNVLGASSNDISRTDGSAGPYFRYWYTVTGDQRQFSNHPQKITFIMPDYPFTVVIKEVSRLKKIIIKPELYQFNNADNNRKITGIYYSLNKAALVFYAFKEARDQCKIEVIPADELQVFVQFSDIYMHLDQTFLIGQEATIYIISAGEFGTVSIPTDVNSKKELYQYFVFNVPNNDMNLNLKWEERLYMIEYDVPEELVYSTYIYDTNKIYDISKTGDQEKLRQTEFPHSTYPKITKNTGYGAYPPEPVENEIKLSTSFVEQIMIVKTEEIEGGGYRSYYVIGDDSFNDSSNQRPLEVSDILTICDIRDGQIDIAFNMPKNNIRFF